MGADAVTVTVTTGWEPGFASSRTGFGPEAVASSTPNQIEARTTVTARPALSQRAMNASAAPSGGTTSVARTTAGTASAGCQRRGGAGWNVAVSAGGNTNLQTGRMRWRAPQLVNIAAPAPASRPGRARAEVVGTGADRAVAYAAHAFARSRNTEGSTGITRSTAPRANGYRQHADGSGRHACPPPRTSEKPLLPAGKRLSHQTALPHRSGDSLVAAERPPASLTGTSACQQVIRPPVDARQDGLGGGDQAGQARRRSSAADR